MRLRDIATTTANDGRYIQLIAAASRQSTLTRVHAAIAYATQTGVAELCGTMSGVDGWQAAEKKWLVGIDYCRSDPFALDHLQRLHGSELRVHDGAFVVRRTGCAPRTSFHPKLYMFHGREGIETVLGSGNLSYTGLKCGLEAGAIISCERIDQIQPVANWFESLWQVATPLGEISERYLIRYSATGNRTRPVPIDDDDVPESAKGSRQLSGSELRQLRICEYFWIQAGKLHKNRGPRRPGNQLMMKRNSRVFFGFQARDLNRDTTVGRIAVTYAGRTRGDCSLRFSNNSMDVLTLPIPGDGGPETYDQQTLCFRRTGVRCFELTVATPRDVQAWRRKSESIGGSFQMVGGRRWGVY